jgi:hypothetical protein
MGRTTKTKVNRYSTKEKFKEIRKKGVIRESQSMALREKKRQRKEEKKATMSTTSSSKKKNKNSGNTAVVI